MTSAGAATAWYMPSASSPTAQKRYCFRTMKMALAATEARTAGNNVLKKNRAFFRPIPILSFSNWLAFGISNKNRTPRESTVIAMMAISRLLVAK